MMCRTDSSASKWSNMRKLKLTCRVLLEKLLLMKMWTEALSLPGHGSAIMCVLPLCPLPLIKKSSAKATHIKVFRYSDIPWHPCATSSCSAAVSLTSRRQGLLAKVAQMCCTWYNVLTHILTPHGPTPLAPDARILQR